MVNCSCMCGAVMMLRHIFSSRKYTGAIQIIFDPTSRVLIAVRSRDEYSIAIIKLQSSCAPGLKVFSHGL